MLYNQYSSLLNNVKETLDISESYIQNSSLLFKEIEIKAKQSAIHVMLYGAYNAGKSTLINALLGEEKAAVADIPKTDKIDEYRWNDIMLLDTPGVNAPIEHEEVTDEQLKKCSVILFVIREGDMDSQDVYNRLVDLLNRNKKIFVVLNNQLSSEIEREQAASHIRDILSKKAKEYNIELSKLSNIDIIPMNVRTALKGRLDNITLLLERSGFSNFIQAFNSWLKQVGSEKEKFNSIKNYTEECWYKPLLSNLGEKLSSVDRDVLRGLEDEKKSLSTQKNILLSEMSSSIREQVTFNRNKILELLKNSDSEEIIHHNLSMIFNEMNQNIESTLKTKIDNVSLHFDKKYAVRKLNEDSHLSDIVFDKIEGIIKKSVTDKNLIKDALLLGRKFKIPFLKGRWEKTLGQFAGKAAIGMQAVVALYDAYSSGKAEDEMNEKQRQYILSLYQTTDQICTDFTTNALEATGQCITEYFNQKIDLLQKEMNTLNNQSNKFESDYTFLSNNYSKMLALEW